MSPEVHFPVGHRTFEEVSELVSQKGIELEPLSKFTSEIYPEAKKRFPYEKDHVDVNGELKFKGELFRFTLQIIEGNKGSLSVDVSDQRLIAANELVETLNEIFPRQASPSSQMVSTSAKVISNRIPWGCLVVFSIISVCLFFFGYGIYTFITR